MTPEIFWIPVPEGRLAIMGRPRAGDWLSDEIIGWRNTGLATIVSLLERPEIVELGLEKEPSLCKQSGLELISFPIPDRGVPESIAMTAELVDTLVSKLSAGLSVAIHCRAGIGRSGLIAACVLFRLGGERDSSFKIIGKSRGVAVPDTALQEQWYALFCKAARIKATG